MFVAFLIAVVDVSRRFAWAVIGVVLALSVLLGVYVADHISINTDINQLLSENLEWRKREKSLETAFPQKVDTLVVVVDGDNGLRVEGVAEALTKVLEARPDMFSMVSRPDALPFFRTNGLLYLSKEDLAGTLDQMTQAQPMVGAMISDPSLRGFFGTVGMMMQGVMAGFVDPADIEKPLEEVQKTLQSTLDGQDRFLDWSAMTAASNDMFAAREKRKYIITKPVLDYSSLQPGDAASAVVRQAVRDLNLGKDGVTVRLTGSVPLSDDEFASVSEGAGVATILGAVLVLALLFMALRTWRIVVPLALSLFVGLIATTAFAAFAVGAFNLISVAFAVMFIGISVDFGIQFGVRYRDEHSRESQHAKALRNTARVIAAPLAMAAGSTSLGFLSFIPTEYQGVSELGMIAGAGMVFAFLLSITFLPALMTVTRPSSEEEHIGFSFLAPLDTFLAKRSRALLPALAVLAIGGLMLATQVRFDFDPLNLKNPNMESVSTMFDLIEDPDSDAYAALLLVPSKEAVQDNVRALATLPEVDHTMSLESFIPEDQEEKLAMIADTKALLDPTFALVRLPAPSDEENIAALRDVAATLRAMAPMMPVATTLADILDKVLAKPSPDLLKKAETSIVTPLKAKFEDMQKVLSASVVTEDSLPQELRRDWVTEDGRRLIEIFPKRGADNDPRNPDMLTRFIDAVQRIAPDVSGAPVSIRESGRTIVSAFIHAGIYGVLSIAFLAFLVLRRVRDVALMLVPLTLAGILTLATIPALGLSLNFANIIALPLLFSLGVSYAVYFVFFGRQGRRDFLQSSMARAVLFSAVTELVAFAALCLSSHPGTRGMGEILTIALLYSVACTFLVLPVLYALRKKDNVSSPS